MIHCFVLFEIQKKKKNTFNIIICNFLFLFRYYLLVRVNIIKCFPMFSRICCALIQNWSVCSVRIETIAYVIAVKVSVLHQQLDGLLLTRILEPYVSCSDAPLVLCKWVVYIHVCVCKVKRSHD